MRDEKTLSLDMGDVEDEDRRSQHGGHPDELGIGGLIHGESCTYNSCAKPLRAAPISSVPARMRSISLEKGPTSGCQHNPGVLHAAAIFKTDQPVGDGIFPDRQMRTAPPPSLSIRITARRFGDPVEKLLR
jgi:hypothetical protein